MLHPKATLDLLLFWVHSHTNPETYRGLCLSVVCFDQEHSSQYPAVVRNGASRREEKEGFWEGGGGFNAVLTSLTFVPSVTRPDLHDTSGFYNSMC